ncbi:TPA: glycosyltransferase family 4 protein [Candidatus Woesearchaeota archaeon]|nr:glycosyltransferase family 4 protein [Candidatus Woesearchaeota archaeon]HIH31562.1 glycosyltransferase family 4 protein [Candidatus Woesearchaeota archaeon]HIH54280.1 glycosyltransferase family 4 protein [Candidatus Woesearchaeota archaeon]HIJ02530.1 glycosyltransferase family 4 protein [Candidatus Woesearchaeota archaeon]HIJ13424.1 glycosyltransferase family 4 protein [Candidatus Woesearchaeota archaeon]
MNGLKNRKLALFLGNGDSLEVWDSLGFLKREMSLYNLLSQYFKEIYIFTYGLKDKRYERILNKNITIIPKFGKLDNRLYEFIIPFKFRKLLKDCDFYKTNQNIAATAPTICKLIYGNKLIVRSGFIGSVNAKLYRCNIITRFHLFLVEFFSYLLCDVAFIPTKQNYDILTRKYTFLKKKLIIMNNFVDTDLFRKKNIPKKYDIIYVARMDDHKNHLELLNAAKGLNLKVCFIGQGYNYGKIKEFAQSNGIDLKIIKRVSNNKMSDYLNSSRIFVFPSLHEGNPKTLLEAMSCELPVIGYNVLGVKNLIKSGHNGLICEPDAQELRTNIIKLSKDGKLRFKIGRNARRFISDNYSLDKLIKKELKIYERLLKN